MGNTSIEWTDKVWNPTTGCNKVSQGCKHCYAERVFPRPYPGRKFTDVQTHPERLEQPLHWRKRQRIFVNSMSDLFHEDVPDKFIDQVFAVMAEAQYHTFQVLTKRPERMRAYLTDGSIEDRISDAWVDLATDDVLQLDRSTWQILLPLSNVWLGVSVENQETADQRIPVLLQTPAAVRFLSVEPMLGPIDLDLNQEEPDPDGCYEDRRHGIHWVIVGGESGPNARPMEEAWVRSIRDQCQAAGVPFFYKQRKDGKQLVSLPLLDGVRHAAFPVGCKEAA